MITPILSTFTFKSQFASLIVLAILAAAFFGRVPRLVLWLLGFFFIVTLFPGDRLAASIGGFVGMLLGPIFALGIVFVALRMIVGGRRSSCSRCDCDHGNCRCRRR